MNPFTPLFGSKPEHFFGRKREKSLFDEALDNEYSPNRVLFLTGNRGCGKTSLLEQLSSIAARSRWKTIDVHSAHASLAIIDQLEGGTERQEARTVAPEVLGFSAGSSAVATSRKLEGFSLPRILVERCSTLVTHKGLFITVDEVQKLPAEDAENLCAATQMAARKGLPLILAMAGLPGAKEKIASYRGCTFMQRVQDINLGSLTIDETVEAFKNMLPLAGTTNADANTIWALADFSKGYPYLMQLIGYYSVESAREIALAHEPVVSIDAIEAAKPMALETYWTNVLDPITSRLGKGTIAYLEAMSNAMGQNGRAETGKVARLLGKSVQECSSYRERLIKRRLVAPDGHGFMRFNLPHMKAYFQQPILSSALEHENTWQY